MATTIKTRLKTTTGGTPSTTAGELCVNTADKKIYIGDGSASVDLFGNLATTAGKLSQFAATTSAELAGVISNETGSGALVFGTSPSISTLEISTTGGVNKTAAINMASGVTAFNTVSSHITLNAYYGDSGNIPAVPSTRTGYISTTSSEDLTLKGGGDSYISIISNEISIGDVSGQNDGTKITVNASGLSVDITGTLNVNGYNVFPLSSVVTAAAALSNSSSAQSVFPVGQQTLTVSQNTTYLIEGEYVINSGTTTHTTAIGFTVGGDVVDLTGLEFTAVTRVSAANTIATGGFHIHVAAAANTQTAVNTTGTNAQTVIQIKGIWKNLTNETITPKIKFSAAPGGTNEMAAGSYIRFTPVGDPTVGAWA